MTSARPTGTVTFLFTDIEGSTRMAQEHRRTWESLRDRHHAILRAALEAHEGYLFEVVGDSFCIAFHSPEDALLTALKAQRDLQAEPWGDAPIRVRMGIHTGVAQPDGERYRGYLALSSVARIMSVAHGGQVLLSQSAFDLVESDLAPDVTVRDMGEHRLKDLLRGQRLYQPVVANLPSDFPPLRTLDARPHNLPIQLTSFVGRDSEILELGALLARSRLVTLAGAGGTGKTRLALQVAAEALDHFKEGAWLVELASLADPNALPETITAALSLREQPGRSAMEVLKDYLQHKQLLLVLDNCEHLLAACASAADTLLRTAPQITILATSRGALGIAGEALFQVGSLSLPDESASSAAQVSRCDAVQLFVERAAAAQPAFELSDQNAAAVAQIARRLDGIPLALELAAVRSRGMTIEQIAARLDDRFRLLTGGSRTALPRQQTLRAAIDWSHDLLSQEERSLFRQLPVFAGSWTLEAAEGVTPAGELGAAQVADLLMALVEKSLVLLDVSSGRYHMLETIREYALERLREAGEEAELRGRHLNYYLALAEELDFGDGERWDTLESLEREQDNLVAALRWCQHAEGGGEQALRMLQAMGVYYWNVTQQNALGFQLAQQSLALPGAEARSPARCRALIALGMAGYFVGREAEARQALEQALSLARENDDSRGIVMAQHWLGGVFNALGDEAAGLRLLDDALRLAKELHFDFEVSGIQNDTAVALQAAGKLDAAQALYEESVANIPAPRTNPFTFVFTLNLAMVTLERGNARRAREILDGSLDLIGQGDPSILRRGFYSGLLVSSGLLAATGRWAHAARIYGAFEAERERLGEPLDDMERQFIGPHLERARNELGEQAYLKAFEEGQRLSVADAFGEVRALLRSGE